MCKCAALLLVTACALGQSRRFTPRQDLAEIIIERFVDVVQIAPKLYVVDRENEKVRILRAKLPGEANVSLHDHRSGILVAVTDVHLRLRTPDKKSFDLHVPAGETRWLDGDNHTEQNLNNRPCEFLFIEMKLPAERTRE
jgi:hypothetical protein